MQSDLAAFGGWCFLAGVFLMVAGDGLTTFNEPIPAEAWPWLYLVPFAVSLMLMIASSSANSSTNLEVSIGSFQTTSASSGLPVRS